MPLIPELFVCNMSSDSLDKITDDAYTSSYSDIAAIVFSSLISYIIISIVGSAGYGIYTTISKNLDIAKELFVGTFISLSRTVPREENEEKNTIVVVSFLIICVILLLSLVPILRFSDLIKTNVFNSVSSELILYITLVYLSLSLFVRYVYKILTSYKKIPQANAVSRWAYPLSKITALLLCSFFLAATVQNVLISLVTASLMTAVIGIGVIKRYTKFNPLDVSLEQSLVKDYTKYVVSATFSSVLAGLQYTSPNLMLVLVTPEQAGAFGVAVVIASTVRIPLSAINSIFPQFATELYDEKNPAKVDRLLKSTSKIAGFLAVIPSIVITVYHDELISLFSAAYVQYKIIVPILVTGNLIAVLIGTVGYLIMVTDNENQNIVIQFILMSITISLSYFLTINYGVIGLSTALSVGLTLNNGVELLYLHYREDIFSITTGHIHLFIVYIAVSLVLSGVNHITGLIISIPVSAGVIVVSTYINYKFALSEPEREALAHKFNSLV
ncbi:lipopolysaccharide biosynthesis protein [Haloquadratum walsbyi]|uniref:Membrane protein involved in the export of O-antigen and teichoic acid n=1 Tax=Haloquadratum walsbyi J07HQW2 TaxID=1238425 RepID=U1NAV4_9EURY|nr:hypothetical protein [Haloquadratum walsbyi]ERG93965.1 MAG: hypothetical protein J07HQW2_00399 [Haloquadratum walsbyi J07HQW2]